MSTIGLQKPVLFIKSEVDRKAFVVNLDKKELTHAEIQRIVQFIAKNYLGKTASSRPRDYIVISLDTPSNEKFQGVAKKADYFFHKLHRSVATQTSFNAHDGITFRELSREEYRELKELEKEQSVLIFQGADVKLHEGPYSETKTTTRAVENDRRRPYSSSSLQDMQIKYSARDSYRGSFSMNVEQRNRDLQRRLLAERDKENDHALLFRA